MHVYLLAGTFHPNPFTLTPVIAYMDQTEVKCLAQGRNDDRAEL